MIKKLLLLSITMVIMKANDNVDSKTAALRKEVCENTKSKVTAETHPILYKIFRKKAAELNIDIPNIRIFKKFSKIFEINAAAIYLIKEFVVVGEELVKTCTYKEIKEVIGHELGHLYHKHAQKMILTVAGAFALFYYFKSDEIKLSISKSLLNPDVSLKIRNSPINAALFYTFVILMNLESRYFEKQADLTATRIGDGKHLISALTKMHKLVSKHQTFNKVLRDLLPLEVKKVFKTVCQFMLGSHPTLKERVDYIEKEILKLEKISATV